jgi:very-short-patch-repair endonuclease
MAWLLLLLAVLLVIAVVLMTLERRSFAMRWPVRQREPLSRPEQALYWRLREACPGHIILAQVAIPQLLEVEQVRNRRAIFNRYHHLVADFVVCTPSFAVLAVIELDESSHTTPGRADADERKSAALGAAGIPLLRFNVRSLPSEGELRSLLVKPAEAAAAPPAPVRPRAAGQDRVTAATA